MLELRVSCGVEPCKFVGTDEYGGTKELPDAIGALPITEFEPGERGYPEAAFALGCNA